MYSTYVVYNNTINRHIGWRRIREKENYIYSIPEYSWLRTNRVWFERSKLESQLVSRTKNYADGFAVWQNLQNATKHQLENKVHSILYKPPVISKQMTYEHKYGARS